MKPAEAVAPRGDPARDSSPPAESSVSASLEHLVAGSQGVITKRVDLALLEGQELVTRSIERAALAGAGTLMATAAWVAGTAAIVLFVAPGANAAVLLTAFGLLNATGAIVLLMLAMRQSRRSSRTFATAEGPALQRALPQPRGRS